MLTPEDNVHQSGAPSDTVPSDIDLAAEGCTAMTDHDGFAEHTDEQATGPGPMAQLLTPKTSAIAGFALAVFSMLGQGSWTIAVQSFFGTNFGPGDYGSVLITGGIASLALAAGGLLLARRVLLEPHAGSPWEHHLAGAAVIIAGLGAVFGVLTIIGGAVGGL